MEIKLNHIIESGLIEVISPYNAEFVNKCRNYRGTFKNNKWYFDDALIDVVKETLMQIYGVDGTEEIEFCTLKVTNFSKSTHTDPVILFGRTIAKAWGRDSGAKLGDDIVLLKGSINSGGSVKNWRTEVNNADLLIRNFVFKRTLHDDIQSAISDGWVIVQRATKTKSKAEIELEIRKHYALIESLKLELQDAV